ncbi:MAG TPA: LamG-like jellyroll fold domain-containing protein, partial [Bdellovibrionota bacterium]|nr:LamG-like jellyroll fold domain-containing protein [Bdellovibrionota bacterium]
FAFFVAWTGQTFALTLDGQGSKSGTIFLYFPSAGDVDSTIKDSSGGTALNLTVPDATKVTRIPEGLRFNGSAFVGASAAASVKILNAVGTSQELSVEAWIKPAAASQSGPARIVTYSIDTTNRNFSLAQDGDKYIFRLRTSDTDANGATFQLNSDNGVPQTTAFQHVVFTRASGGAAALYVDGVVVASGSVTGTINNWNNTYRFGLGNEVTQNRIWNGDIALVAVYNRALSPAEASGEMVKPAEKLMEPESGESQSDRDVAGVARRLYIRLAGVALPMDHPTILGMRDLLKAGKKQEAAQLATAEASFYNITVRQFASKMATKEETPQAALGDFVTTVIGVTRDGASARELLTGNYVYQGDPGKVQGLPVDSASLYTSNAHFDFLDARGADLADVLIKVPQKIAAPGGLVDTPDPAGVLTSRQWAESFFSAGTNRRPVAYTFREFMCLPMESWASASRTDSFVGRDVDRAPGGDVGVYATKCKSCHAGMDGLRGAFAHWDFRGGQIMNGTLFQDGTGDGQMPQNPATIAAKLNGNNGVFPAGHTTVDDSFVLFATSSDDMNLFGWKTMPSVSQPGHGTHEFGDMISQSERFPYCMAKRVFTEVCRREPADTEQAFIRALGSDFKASGYKIKDLFERAAVAPPCLGM